MSRLETRSPARYLRLACRHLRNEGHDVDALLESLGLRWSDLESRRDMLSQREVHQFVAAIQRLVQRPSFALELGSTIELTDLGAVGATMAASGNLRQALAPLHYFWTLCWDTMEFALSFTRGGALITLESRLPQDDQEVLRLEHVVAALSNLFRSLIRMPLKGSRLELPWGRPAWADAYTGLADVIYFQSTRVAIWLPNSLLDAPCFNTSQTDQMEGWRRCEEKLRKQMLTQTLSEKMRRNIQTGNMSWTFEPSVCEELGLSRSALQRKLKEEGTTFRTLLTQARMDRAQALLRSAAMSLQDIALALGYTDQTNFIRAFRKQFGITPAQHRRNPGAHEPRQPQPATRLPDFRASAAR